MRHIEAKGVMEQDDRHAIVKVPGQTAQRMTTHEVRPDYAREKRVEAFVQKAIEASDFAAPLDAISEEINQREMRLLKDVKQYLSADEEEEPVQLPKWG